MTQLIETVANATGIPDFYHQDLLQLALSDPETIGENHNLTPKQKQEQILEHQGLISLGSMVFDAIVTDYLAQQFSSWSQSTRTILKSDLVNCHSLSEFCQELHLEDLGQFHQPLQWKHPREQDRILAEMFEAFVGVLYLEFHRDFLLAQRWLVQRLLHRAVTNLLKEAFAEDELELIGFKF